MIQKFKEGDYVIYRGYVGEVLYDPITSLYIKYSYINGNEIKYLYGVCKFEDANLCSKFYYELFLDLWKLEKKISAIDKTIKAW